MTIPWRNLARRVGVVVAVAVAAGVAIAVWLSLRPADYRAEAVVVPVAGQRAASPLSGGVASLLGTTVRVGGGEFEATQDVVAYLLRSRSVLMAVANRPFGAGTIAEALTGRPPTAGNEEDVLRALRRRIRVTQSAPTGFVTATVDLPDSAMSRALVAEALGVTRRVFREIAQAQATELVLAQEQRLDSADAALRQAEARLLEFDRRNRIVPERSQLSLDRVRLEREVAQGVQVQQSVQVDRQSAIARQLEQAAAVAIVEALPADLPRRSKRVALRATLVALAVAAFGSIGIGMLMLLRGYRQ